VPLSVEIKINGREIETIRIGRVEEMKGKTHYHEYLVTAPDGEYASFMHKYDEGARVCVAKALEALRQAAIYRENAWHAVQSPDL